MENMLCEFNPEESLTVIGDMNMDLATNKGDELRAFMSNWNGMKNYVFEYTRIAETYQKKKQTTNESKTIIDVVYHNKKQVIKTKTVACPFSDHRFVIVKLKLEELKADTSQPIIGRALPQGLMKSLINLKKLILEHYSHQKM